MDLRRFTMAAPTISSNKLFELMKSGDEQRSLESFGLHSIISNTGDLKMRNLKISLKMIVYLSFWFLTWSVIYKDGLTRRYGKYLLYFLDLIRSKSCEIQFIGLQNLL